MTDFVNRVVRKERNDWIIRSLLDVDFYKFTMAQLIYKHYRKTKVEFTLINRHKHIPLMYIIDRDELGAQLSHAESLRFTPTEIAYLRGMRIHGHVMFEEDFIEFLEKFKLPKTYVMSCNQGDQCNLVFTGTWAEVTFWETIALAIISELYYRTLMRGMSNTDLSVLYSRATDKIYRKLLRIKENGNILFADFGQRRRHSFLWQQFVIQMAKEVLGPQFTGTSNTYMAFDQALQPVGTNAHELPMVLTAIAPDRDKRKAQYEVLHVWEKTYMQALLIMLGDTYGSEQFFHGMPSSFAQHIARTWRGARLDSGDPIKEGNLYIDWLAENGVDAWRAEKLIIPSDALDVDPMFEIEKAFRGRIRTSFGWGTFFTNDMRECHPRPDERMVQTIRHGHPLTNTWGEVFRPLSIVCKVTAANGKPAVKLSNNIEKATGPKDEIAKYLGTFGARGRVTQEVLA